MRKKATWHARWAKRPQIGSWCWLVTKTPGGSSYWVALGTSWRVIGAETGAHYRPAAASVIEQYGDAWVAAIRLAEEKAK